MPTDPSITLKAIRYEGGGAVDVSLRGNISGQQLADALASIIEQCWDIADEHDRKRARPEDDRITDLIREHWKAYSDGDFCMTCGGIEVLGGSCGRCGSDYIRLDQ